MTVPGAIHPSRVRRTAGWGGGLALALLMFLLAFTPGISFMEDLGRHLLLGRIILETGHVPENNLLTFTHPEYPFINHHWLSEVIFYLLHRTVGLNGLIVLKAWLMAGTLLLAMRTLWLERLSARVGLAAALGAVVLAFRAHVRPELFTYFGVALYAWGFERLRRRAASPLVHTSISVKWRAVAAVFLLYGWFWTNAHIYFIFGLGMAAAFFIERLVNRWREGATRWSWADALWLLTLAGVGLLNPNGWRGLLYPLGIFRNYGLPVTENASPLELWQSVLNPMLLALPILSLLSLWALVRLTVLRPRGAPPPERWANYIILLVALAAAWRMARSAPLLAIAALPVIGEWARWPRSDGRLHRMARRAGIAGVGAMAIGLAAGVLDGWYVRIFPSPIGPTPFGLDHEDRYLALQALYEDGLPGRVFSDYNIGSLVEYNIFPEPAYVDNRPEAFPESFWTGEYLPALALGPEGEQIWRARGIRSVAVSLPGVKDGFVRAMMSRPEWKLVHLDFLLAVWVLATEENSPFIERHLYTRSRLETYSEQMMENVRRLPGLPFWRRQVTADQLVYELYSLACVDEIPRMWPILWEFHHLYPDYQLLHELLRISAPPEAVEDVKTVMAARARWPLAAKQVLDWGAVLESEGRLDEARRAYGRGRFFFPLSPELRERLAGLP